MDEKLQSTKVLLNQTIFQDMLFAPNCINFLFDNNNYISLQLCRSSDVNIKNIILRQHKKDFIKKLPMASSLCQYFYTSNGRISGGLNFIHTIANTDSSHKIFKAYFAILNKVNILI